MPTSDSPFDCILSAAPDTFAFDLGAHLRYGYVLSSPEYFLMARPVSLDWSLEQFRDPTLTDPTGNCWWVWATSGDWRKAALHGLSIHGWKDWLGFDRREKPRFVATRKLLALERM